ncbi:MAG: hypothetical protein J6S69_04795 [Proteobacteria bacterium]|nr:hypothetical protein [Pseudomonadota bacterium]
MQTAGTLAVSKSSPSVSSPAASSSSVSSPAVSGSPASSPAASSSSVSSPAVSGSPASSPAASRSSVSSPAVSGSPASSQAEEIFWPDNFQEVSVSWSSDEMSLEDWSRYGGDDDEDEGGEEAGSNNLQQIKKRLEVSDERHKNAPPFGGPEKSEVTNMQRWKRVVSQLGVPLSTMMSRASVTSITNSVVGITLPVIYRDMVKSEHIKDVERILSREVALGCRLSIQYDGNVDESETLAAQEARAALEFQQSEFDKVKRGPMIQMIHRLFHVELDEIRFTFNPDRILK